jgi:hypothetical protein
MSQELQALSVSSSQITQFKLFGVLTFISQSLSSPEILALSTHSWSGKRTRAKRARLPASTSTPYFIEITIKMDEMDGDSNNQSQGLVSRLSFCNLKLNHFI